MSDARTVEWMAVPKRILLLNNELRVTRLVRQAFQNTGEYLFNEESNPQIAFRTAQNFQPDIIFFDLTGNALNWSDALQQIRSHFGFAKTPFVMLSSTSGDGSIAYSSSVDGYEFSANPVKVEELVRYVEEMLQV